MKRPLLILLISAAVGAGGGSAFRVFRGNHLTPAAVGQLETHIAAQEAENTPSTSSGNAKSGILAADSPHPVVKLPPRPSLEELRAAPKEDRLRLLVRWLPEADASEVAALAQEWFPKALGSGDEIWQVLVQRWVEVDAPTAISYSRKLAKEILDEHSGQGWSGNIRVITPMDYTYRALARVDPDLALSFLAEEPAMLAKRLASEFQQSLGAEKMRQWALEHKDRSDLAFLLADPEYKLLDLSDPAKAATSLTPEQLKYQSASLAGEWAKKDPDAAVAWAKGIESADLRDNALAAITKALLETNPEKAREILESMPASRTQAKAGAGYVSALAKTDPAAAMAWLEKNLKGASRFQGIAALAAARAESDPAGALRLLRENGVNVLNASMLSGNRIVTDDARQMPVGDMNWDLSRALKAVASQDPAAAMQFLGDSGSIQADVDVNSNRTASFLADSLFKQWAGKDPAAAARWAASQPAGDATKMLAAAAAAPWFAKNPGETQAFAASLPEGPGRDAFVQTTATLIAAGDPNAALTWTTQNGSGDTIAAVYRYVIQTNPEAAVGQFNAMPEAVQADQMQSLTDILGQRAPAEALGFYQSLPPERQAAVKLYNTTQAWARQDPQAASEWITTLPSTYAKDTAISGLVDYLIKDAADPDPQSAAYWAAASITPDGRDRRLKRVAEAWFQRDPNAAAAIGSTTLPDDVKQTLLNHAPAK